MIDIQERANSTPSNFIFTKEFGDPRVAFYGPDRAVPLGVVLTICRFSANETQMRRAAVREKVESKQWTGGLANASFRLLKSGSFSEVMSDAIAKLAHYGIEVDRGELIDEVIAHDYQK